MPEVPLPLMLGTRAPFGLWLIHPCFDRILNWGAELNKHV